MYYVQTIGPAFSDTNAAGHIDHLAYADWFDRARTYLYREMDPTLVFRPHGLAVVTTTVYYDQEASVVEDVEVRTWTSKIGRKSFETRQEAWQNGERLASCKTVFCGFDFDKRTSEPLCDDYRAAVEMYYWEPEAK
ncbi:MAG: hypothetical protein IJM30_09955 [Thermoguttaceae bacterium]|nr:hypothetical protein [Thermoguttaceae bacterium]